MLLYLLLTFSVGIEGGYNQPITGLENINSGATFALLINRECSSVNTTLAIATDFYQGKNPGYALNLYDLSLGFSKANWRLSPVLEVGANYLTRSVSSAHESGFVLNYCLGVLINFPVDRLRIYPKFYYNGLTDFKTQAGFIGLKFGVAYEM